MPAGEYYNSGFQAVDRLEARSNIINRHHSVRDGSWFGIVLSPVRLSTLPSTRLCLSRNPDLLCDCQWAATRCFPPN